MKKFKEMDFVDKINDELTLIFKSLFLRSLKIEGTTLNNKKFILETFVPEGEPTIPDSQCLKTQYFRLKTDGQDKLTTECECIICKRKYKLAVVEIK